MCGIVYGLKYKSQSPYQRGAFRHQLKRREGWRIQVSIPLSAGHVSTLEKLETVSTLRSLLAVPFPVLAFRHLKNLKQFQPSTLVSIPLSAGHVSTSLCGHSSSRRACLNPLISGARFDERRSILSRPSFRSQSPYQRGAFRHSNMPSKMHISCLNPLISGARFDEVPNEQGRR